MSLQFLGQFVAPRALAELVIFLVIDDVALEQQRSHLSLELPFVFENALIDHGLWHAGIGFHLGAAQRHLAQAHKSRALARPDHLNEQAGQSTQETPVKFADLAVVRPLSRSALSRRRLPRRPSRSCASWAAQRSWRTGAARASIEARMFFRPADSSAGRERGSPQDSAPAGLGGSSGSRHAAGS